MRMSQGEQSGRSARRLRDLRDLLDADFDHLSVEAIAAYVDRELTPGAFHRATCHLDNCERCRREVIAQQEASRRLRAASANALQVSAALMQRLAAIPEAAAQHMMNEMCEEAAAQEAQQAKEPNTKDDANRETRTGAAKLTEIFGEMGDSLRDLWVGKK